MTFEVRVLDPEPVRRLTDHADAGAGIAAADRLGPAAVVDLLTRSGLRGRGGAGFPTGVKWQTVIENRSPRHATSVVVNGAEGEPGTYKDRAILLANPYRMLEGAAIAARAVSAVRVVIALKETFVAVHDRIRAAVAEAGEAGWFEGMDLDVVLGPSSYLFGEETALLEVANGRPPFPQVAPPYRRGLELVAEEPSSEASVVDLAGPADDHGAAPTVVDNVETLSNVAAIIARGPEWFRSVGTADSPGTVVSTVSGDTRRAGVAEVELGRPLRGVLDEIGGGMPEGRRIQFVLAGVSTGIIPDTQLDVKMTHADLRAIGSGLGTAGFLVFDDRASAAAVAHGVSTFLAVESCGQCTPCKGDGLELMQRLDRVRSGRAHRDDMARIEGLAAHVEEGARCFLGRQHREVLESLLLLELPDFSRHGTPQEAASTVLIAPIDELAEGVARIDARQAQKNPDWSYGGVESGRWPANAIDVDEEAEAEAERAQGPD
jgi:NADH:ubiquinone oxidoreductase subunit F (NADH-binding)